MGTKAERIVELLTIISSKSERIKKLKLECGQQATQICVLNLRIKELEVALGEATIDLAKGYLRIKELEELLTEYGRHLEGCAAPYDKKYPCRCGWDRERKHILKG